MSLYADIKDAAPVASGKPTDVRRTSALADYQTYLDTRLSKPRKVTDKYTYISMKSPLCKRI